MRLNLDDQLTFKGAAKPQSEKFDGALASRRDLLMGPLLAALPLALLGERAEAAPDPTMTIVKLPADIAWVDMFTTGEGARSMPRAARSFRWRTSMATCQSRASITC